MSSIKGFDKTEKVVYHSDESDSFYYEANDYFAEFRSKQLPTELQSKKISKENISFEYESIKFKDFKTKDKIKNPFHSKKLQYANQHRPRFLCPKIGLRKRTFLLLFKTMVEEDRALRLSRKVFYKSCAELLKVQSLLSALNKALKKEILIAEQHLEEISLQNRKIEEEKEIQTSKHASDEIQFLNDDNKKELDRLNKYKKLLKVIFMRDLPKLSPIFYLSVVEFFKNVGRSNHKNLRKILNTLIRQFKAFEVTINAVEKDLSSKVEKENRKYKLLANLYETNLRLQKDKLQAVQHLIDKYDLENSALVKISQDYFCTVKVTSQRESQTELKLNEVTTDILYAKHEHAFREYVNLMRTVKKRKSETLHKKYLEYKDEIKSLEIQVENLEIEKLKNSNESTSFESMLERVAAERCMAEEMLENKRLRNEKIIENVKEAHLENRRLKYMHKMYGDGFALHERNFS